MDRVLNQISVPHDGGGTSGKDAGETGATRAPVRRGSCVEDRTFQIVWSLDRSSDVGRALLAATRRLREVEIESAQLDAAVLMAFVLGVGKAWLYAHPSRPLTEPEISLYETLVRRRMCHEPVAYLVGYKPFYGLDITVDQRVLIPRPETEMLVERALTHARRMIKDGVHPVAADIGTGSGAIAVALAANAPELTIYATDVSPASMEVAEKNVWRYGLGEQVHLLPGYLLDPLPAPVDIVVANLPYVATADLATLPPQVRDFEPVLALDGGSDGCLILHALVHAMATAEGRAKIKPGGVALLEIGADQGDAVSTIVSTELPGHEFTILADYSGFDRILMINL